MIFQCFNLSFFSSNLFQLCGSITGKNRLARDLLSGLAPDSLKLARDPGATSFKPTSPIRHNSLSISFNTYPNELGDLIASSIMELIGFGEIVSVTSEEFIPKFTSHLNGELIVFTLLSVSACGCFGSVGLLCRWDWPELGPTVVVFELAFFLAA